MFNNSIQELYSSLGTPGELDRFLGTARLDTLYIAVAQQHNLAKHYSIAQDDHAPFNAALKLKKESRIDRTEYGELQVQVWDVDRQLAAALANSLLQQLQQLHQQLQSERNRLVLQKLQEAYAGLTAAARLVEAASLPAAARESQAAEYEKLIAQYSLMVRTNPPALLVVEEARPALTHDKPYVWPTLLLTFFAALLFSFLAVLVVESRSSKNV